jgi:outer membrane protease
MKNHLIRQYSFLFFLFSAVLVHAENPLSGSLQTHLGSFFGGMNEYVYEEGREHELSRLEWEENFVPYVAVAGELTAWNFFLNLSLISAIPVKSGFMQDFDYMLPSSDETSHYSKHDAMFEKHLEISPKIGYLFDFGKWYIAPSAGILFRNRKWSAVDGYTQYPDKGPWNEGIEKKDMAGVVISYEESMWSPIVTLSGGFNIGERFGIGLTGTWYPYLFINTIDSHMIRATRFHDTMEGGFGILGELSFTYYPKGSDMLNFIFAAGYEGIFAEKGTTASGAIGYDNGLVIDSGYQSKMESNLGWISLGVMMYPELMWKK